LDDDFKRREREVVKQGLFVASLANLTNNFTHLHTNAWRIKTLGVY
jgi:hypothetical protein